MMISARGWRALSLLALLLALAAGALAWALPGVQRVTQRGALDTYPPPMRGGEQLLFGTNTALEQYDTATLDARVQLLAQQGIRTVRQEFRWNELEPRKGEFDWRNSDAIFAALRRHNLRALPVLWTTPAWARGSSGNAAQPATATSPPRDPADFAAFARAFAARYGAGDAIVGYQIWDEPNLSAAWGNGVVQPQRYLDLLRASGSAIREAQPTARIVLAGLAPTAEWTEANQPPQVYLARLYDLGAANAFDVAAAKPYGFDFSPYDRRVDFGVLNFSHPILIYETMISKGDSRKAVWLVAGGWNALPVTAAERKSIWGQVSVDEQTRFIREAAQRAAHEWYWAGALFLQELEPANAKPDDPRRGFALIEPNGQPKPLLDAMRDAAITAQTAARGQSFAVCEYGTAIAPADCHRGNANVRFSPGWRFGELGADAPEVPGANDTPTLDDNPAVHFSFIGESLALELRRGDYRANAFVFVDGLPANALAKEPRGAYVPLWSADLKPRVERIEVARNLKPGVHTAEVILDRGWNQWALAGWSSKSSDASLSTRDYTTLRLIALFTCALGALAFAFSLRHAQWRALLAPLRDVRVAPSAVASALIVWGAAALTWAQDASFAFRNFGGPAGYALGALASATWVWAPVFAIGLIGLVVLFAVVIARLDVGLALLAFFIPFFLLPQRVFAWSFSMVELLTLMCLVSFVMRKLVDGRRRTEDGGCRVRMSLLDAGMLALVAAGVIATAYARQQVEAWRELRMAIVEPALVYGMLRLTPLSTTQRRNVLLALLAGGLAVACIGLVNYARGVVFPAELGIPRIRSVYGSPNNDALYLGRIFAILLPAAILAREWAHARWQRIAVWTALGVVVLALVLSQSRGALLLGVPVCAITVCLAAGGRWRTMGLSGLIALGAGLLLLASGIGSQLFAGTRLANALDLSRGTGFIRINLWQSALRMWMDNAWTGVGPDNFLYAYRSNYILPAAWQEPNLSHPHNVLLDFATRLGAGGLIALGMIVTGAGRMVARGLRSTAARPMALISLGVLAYTLGHGLVDHSFFLIDLAFAWAVVMGLVRYSDALTTGRNTPPTARAAG